MQHHTENEERATCQSLLCLDLVSFVRRCRCGCGFGCCGVWCGVVDVVCVWYGVVWCDTLKNTTCVHSNVPVCTGTKPTCIKHVGVVLVHTETFWTCTRRRVRCIHPFLPLPPQHTPPTNNRQTQVHWKTKGEKLAKSQETTDNTTDRQQTTQRGTTPDTRHNGTREHDTCDQSHTRRDKTKTGQGQQRNTKSPKDRIWSFPLLLWRINLRTTTRNSANHMCKILCTRHVMNAWYTTCVHAVHQKATGQYLLSNSNYPLRK